MEGAKDKKLVSDAAMADEGLNWTVGQLTLQ